MRRLAYLLSEGRAVISLSALVSLAVYLAVAGLVCWLLLWVIDYVGPPEPFRKAARVAVVVLGVLAVIGVLLQLAGVGGPVFRP